METSKTVEALKEARRNTQDPKLQKEIDEKIKVLESGKDVLK